MLPGENLKAALYSVGLESAEEGIAMQTSELDAVTGAFGYTGRYIARRLLARGKKVLTLTGHPDRPNPFGDQVRTAPFHFDNPEALAQSLEGVSTLYNTYWVRFSYGKVTFDQAVENTKTLISAAEKAGVRRIVHVSITNPSEDSPLPYFKGKGVLEKAIQNSRLSYALIRPTVIFGAEDILINNIAWCLRRFPVFAVAGSGQYRLQPIFVEDMADLTVQAGQSDENITFDAVGPDIFTFEQLVSLIAIKIKRRARIIHISPGLALLLSRLISFMVHDVVLTREEVEGLMADLLISPNPPAGWTHLSDWLDRNADRVGMHYASEVERHYRQGHSLR